MIQDDNVLKLQEQIKDIMPLLDKNLGLTNDAYMNKGLPHGAFCHVLNRHDLALTLANTSLEDFNDNVTPKMFFQAGCMLFVDLRAMINDLIGDEKKAAEEKRDAMMQLYRDNGFTGTHVLFKAPTFEEKAVIA